MKTVAPALAALFATQPSVGRAEPKGVDYGMRHLRGNEWFIVFYAGRKDRANSIYACFSPSFRQLSARDPA